MNTFEYTDELTCEDICRKIRDDEPFAFSRWGDGEWNCIWQRGDKNCDNHLYFTDLGERLLEILKGHPEYYVGMQPLSIRIFGNKIPAFFKRYNLTDLKWVNADVLHDASVADFLEEFFAALKGKNVLLVGPERLNALGWPMVTIPLENCWKEHDRILHDIQTWMASGRLADVVLFCAGPLSNPLIDELWKWDDGDTTLLDCGSLLAPYIGLPIRRYHPKLIQRLKERDDAKGNA